MNHFSPESTSFEPMVTQPADDAKLMRLLALYDQGKRDLKGDSYWGIPPVIVASVERYLINHGVTV